MVTRLSQQVQRFHPGKKKNKNVPQLQIGADLCVISGHFFLFFIFIYFQENHMQYLT